MSQDPHDQLLLQIRGVVAEYERNLIDLPDAARTPSEIPRGNPLTLEQSTLRVRRGPSSPTRSNRSAARRSRSSSGGRDVQLLSARRTHPAWIDKTSDRPWGTRSTWQHVLE